MLAVVAAAPANALSEQQIQRNCEAAGGTYFRAPNDGAGNRMSSCCAPIPSTGKTRCYDYINGVYSPSQAPPPVTGPGTPPPGEAPPIGANPPEAH